MRQALRVTTAVLFVAVTLAPSTGWAAAGRGDSAKPAVNGPSVPTVKSGWVNFTWDETGEVGPYVFTSLNTRYLIAVDSYCRGDQFAVYDNGALLGETTSVPLDPECDDIPARDGPIESFTDPTFSSGVFVLAPGDHSITIMVIVNPFFGGGAYFGLGFQPR